MSAEKPESKDKAAHGAGSSLSRPWPVGLEPAPKEWKTDAVLRVTTSAWEVRVGPVRHMRLADWLVCGCAILPFGGAFTVMLVLTYRIAGGGKFAVAAAIAGIGFSIALGTTIAYYRRSMRSPDVFRYETATGVCHLLLRVIRFDNCKPVQIELARGAIDYGDEAISSLDEVFIHLRGSNGELRRELVWWSDRFRERLAKRLAAALGVPYLRTRCADGGRMKGEDWQAAVQARAAGEWAPANPENSPPQY